MALLEIENLSVDFPTVAGVMRAVDGVSLRLEEGEVLGIVGESGSGKSVTMLALMGLVAYPGEIRADRLAFAGKDLLSLSPGDRRRLVGKDLAMIFQEPTTSLNPCFTIGFQLQETLLVQVGIPAPESRLHAFPHQLSGGMNQRVMIAMAIACNPRLLIADEPTTALDVTIQAQILDLLLKLQRERGMALILITHNMGVVAETAQRVSVMYAGQVVEERSAAALFAAPQHPYTAALLAALPERSTGETRLATIPGVVPGLHDRPVGCLFHPRCLYAIAHRRSRCRRDPHGDRTCGAAPRRADCFPESLRLLESAKEGRRYPRGAARHQHQAEQERAGGGIARHDGQGWPPARALRALSAHVLGRPASAHRDRPRPHAAAAPRRRRRAGLRARCLDPGPGPQPAQRSAGRVPPVLSLHLTRSRRRPPRRRRTPRHVSRPAGRAGSEESDLRASAPPLHASPARLDAGHRSRQEARAHRLEGRAALAARSALRLRLQHTLPARHRTLPRRKTRAPRGRRAAGVMPLRGTV